MRMRRISGDSRNEPPVLLVKWYDVTKWLLDRVDSFPKNQRFVFGQRIADRTLNILEALVEDSYEESRRKVEQILGIGQSVRSLEQMSVSVAETVSAFQESAPKPPAAQEGSILVLTADGKGVPMRRDAGQDPPAIRGRRKKGEKANKKRMACVGGVYTIDPSVKTAEDVVDEVLRAVRKTGGLASPPRAGTYHSKSMNSSAVRPAAATMLPRVPVSSARWAGTTT